MRIHYLQHVPFETPASIIDWVQKKGHILTGTHLYNYEAVPQMQQFDCVVIMGGPMNIYEEDKYPWLKYEKQFIKEAINSNKAVIGICLGAQLITEVLGGKVTKNSEAEIGWLPIDFNENILGIPIFNRFPKSLTVFQWHNDTFSTLGEGCTSIASSEVCKNQAFIYKDRVIGFQFHMESTKDSIHALISNCSKELVEGKYVQSKEEIEEKIYLLEGLNAMVENFMDKVAGNFK